MQTEPGDDMANTGEGCHRVGRLACLTPDLGEKLHGDIMAKKGRQEERKKKGRKKTNKTTCSPNHGLHHDCQKGVV